MLVKIDTTSNKKAICIFINSCQVFDNVKIISININEVYYLNLDVNDCNNYNN